MKHSVKLLVNIIALAAAFAATDASAQGVNLSGRWQCVTQCTGAPGSFAYITQNGWGLNMVSDSGIPSRAWIDWPGHIWVDRSQEGAIYSPDGFALQFDRGTVWRRDLEEPVTVGPEVATPTAKPKRGVAAAVHGTPAPAVRPPAAAATAFDGGWSVVIMTQRGACDRAYRYGVRISNGYVSNDGSAPVNLQGRVAPNGNIRVNVSSGGQAAEGEGRLTKYAGNGTWSGQGASGSCSGVWQAERRG